MTNYSVFVIGLFVGAAAHHVLVRGSIATYRRWYLMCRNELEKLDPTNQALRKIGARTSKRESWEQ